MLRRWRQEIGIHEGTSLGRGLPPLPPDACKSEEVCHCYRGMGFMRKRRAYGCRKPRCHCKYWKLYERPARANRKRAAIAADVHAWQGDRVLVGAGPLDFSS